jgi:hypothetical protein
MCAAKRQDSHANYQKTTKGFHFIAERFRSDTTAAGAERAQHDP